MTTRICEKFIEEITSGSGAASAELTAHLASCSACREAFESLRQIKAARKTMTGKEAAAIAGILKAVQTGAAASTAAASGQTSGSGSMLLKPLVIVICALSVICALFMQDRSPQAIPGNDVSITETVSPVQVAVEPVVSVDESEVLTDNGKVGSAAVESALPGDAVAVASDSTNAESQEDNKTGEAQTISVSPDQEDIKLR
ncbi:MAG: hypothetical protein A2W80_06500 [Candidatus Riflebacteria bacterium GWC2_50_8]|nr:MAG: hypothetical protein A2W80_06500 [Candidatus Riflebacteria bacterium GWC2_50_8]